jgi:hypothetical protein
MDTEQPFSFCPELQAMVSTHQAVGRTGKTFEELGALSSENNLITLRHLCMQLKPRLTLEVGLSFGGSCLVFVACRRDLAYDLRISTSLSIPIKVKPGMTVGFWRRNGLVSAVISISEKRHRLWSCLSWSVKGVRSILPILTVRTCSRTYL